MRRAVTTGMCAAALAVAGCGGSSEGGYLSRLDELCDDAAERNAEIAAQVADGDLTRDGAARQVAEQSAALRGGIGALRPPSALQDEHEALRAALAPAGAIGLDDLERLADAYAAVKADGCEAGMRTTIDRARAAQG